jgi:hypothetical protein
MEVIMLKKIFLFLVILFSGCSIPEQELKVDTYPQLKEEYPLPSFPYPYSGTEFRLNTRIFLSENGDVISVKLLNTGWDADWDAAAIKQLLKWKFTPAILDGKPISLWIKQPVLIKTSVSSFLYLSEIVCNEKRLIDSVYVLIRSGESFENLVKLFSVSKSKDNYGYLGKIDIQTFPLNVQAILRNTIENSISPVIKIGEQYYIYKKLSDKQRI